MLAALGAARGPAVESTFRRAFALVNPDVLDQGLGTWLHTRAVPASGRLVITIDGKAVRGAKDMAGKAPHLAAALAHGIGAVLGQIAVTENPDEIPAVRECELMRVSGSAGSPADSLAGGRQRVSTLCDWALEPWAKTVPPLASGRVDR